MLAAYLQVAGARAADEDLVRMLLTEVVAIKGSAGGQAGGFAELEGVDVLDLAIVVTVVGAGGRHVLPLKLDALFLEVRPPTDLHSNFIPSPPTPTCRHCGLS